MFLRRGSKLNNITIITMIINLNRCGTLTHAGISIVQSE